MDAPGDREPATFCYTCETRTPHLMPENASANFCRHCGRPLWHAPKQGGCANA